MSGAVLHEENERFTDLALILDGLASDYLPGVSREALGERCLLLLSARDRLEALMAASVAEAERSGVSALGSQRTMAQYLASRSHCAPEVVRADARVGLWVSDFAVLEEAMLNGQLSRRHVDLLRKTDNIRVFASMQRDQAMFIDFADKLEWNNFKSTIKYWVLANDPDGPEPEDYEAKNSCIISRQADGTVKITITLDPYSGAIVARQIETEAGYLFDEDQEDSSIVHTPTQRRAKAFTNLVERGAGRSETNAKPLVHVVMSLKVLEHTIAQMAKAPEEQDFTSVLDPNDIDGRCELIDGTPLHPKYALMLLMQARIRRQVLGAKNVTLDASYEARLFPDWMKYIRLIETRGQCETAGCDALLEWLRADHHKPFSETQRTALADLRNICDPDNTLKSNGPPLAERTAPEADNKPAREQQ